MKKRIIVMLLLTCIFLSACGQKPVLDAPTSAPVTAVSSESTSKDPTPTPKSEATKPEPETTANQETEAFNEPSRKVEIDLNSFTEDWPSWFVVPNYPEDEEVKQAIQGKEFDALPTWMQVMAVRPNAVVNDLSMDKNLVDPSMSTLSLMQNLRRNPEYILLIMSRQKTLYEKLATGKWDGDITNPPPEYTEIQEIIKEVIELE